MYGHIKLVLLFKFQLTNHIDDKLKIGEKLRKIIDLCMLKIVFRINLTHLPRRNDSPKN